MRQSDLEKAIANLEGERQVIDLAIAKLRAQVGAAAGKKQARPRIVPQPAAKESA